MTTQILRSSSTGLPVCGPRRPARGWMTWALMVYVLYLGIVLPFVCWGAVGAPGHPHPVAHFVFAVPEATHAPHFPGHETPPAEDPAGQSRPDTTLISLILLVFVGMWLRFGPNPHRFSRLWTRHNWCSISLPIPTPPPRSLDGRLPILAWDR